MTNKTETQTKVKDPICGKEIDPASAMFTSQYKGKTYYFDSEMCKRQFDEDPSMHTSEEGGGQR